MPAARLRVLAYGGFAGRLPLLVDRHEVAVGHVDFAADFERFGHVAAGEPQRHAQHGADVVRDVVAGPAVAAGRAADQQAVFVDDGDRHAVDLQLHDPLDRLAAQQLVHARAEFSQLLGAVRVVDREHRHAVRDRRQGTRPARRRRAAWGCRA